MQQKILEFSVNDQHIRIPRTVVVADSRDYLTARFTFNETWRDLTKTAVFQGADGQAYYMLLEDDCCRVPEEVIQPTRFLVSVFGGDRLTTDRAMVEVEASGFTPNGIDPPVPTPDVYNQLLESVALDRQVAEASAVTAAEKAEECAYLTTSAEGLLENAIGVNDLVTQAQDHAFHASAHALLAEEKASIATDAAQRAETAANIAADAADRVSMKLLKTVTLEEEKKSIAVTFDKPLKELYVVFTGRAGGTDTVSNCTLASYTGSGGQYFFYTTAHTLYADRDIVYIFHAKEIVERRWETLYPTSTLSTTLQGISSSSSSVKTSYSKRRDSLSRYVDSLSFFIYNEVCNFAVGSTLEIWGVEAE